MELGMEVAGILGVIQERLQGKMRGGKSHRNGEKRVDTG
jgi:hypothetical protein